MTMSIIDILAAGRAFRRGQRHAAHGEFDRAVQEYEKSLASRPNNSHMQLHYALALAELGREQEALDTIRRAIELDGRSPVMPIFLGRLLCDFGRYEEAMEVLTRAVERVPRNRLAHGCLALALLGKGQVEEAYARLSEAGLTDNVAVRQRIAAALEAYIYAHRGPGFEEPPLAAEDGRTVLGRLVNRWRAKRRLARGSRFLDNEKPQAAIAELQHALRLCPGLKEAHFLLGQAYFDVGSFEQAKEELQKARVPSGQKPVLQFYLGAIEYRLGRHEEAIRLLSEAQASHRLALYDLIEYCAYYKGLAHVALGQTAAAQAEFGEVLRVEWPLVTERLKTALAIAKSETDSPPADESASPDGTD